MKTLRSKLSFANVIASLALFIALGGGAYAATQLPKNSVGTTQIQNNAVTPAKLSAAAESGMEGPRGPAGPKGPTGAKGATGPTGPKGETGSRGEKGDKGDKGDQGERGVPGPEGDPGPLTVDASAQASAVPLTTGTYAIPLSGTTSWTPAPDEIGIVSAQMVALLAVNHATSGTEPIEECEPEVVLRDNGRSLGFLGGFASGANSLSNQTTLEKHYSSLGETIGVLEPGTQHVFTAEYIGNGLNTHVTGCKAGSEIQEVRIVVAPQG
jgi:hypothetical protein